MPDFATLTAAVDSGVATVRLNRPDRANSINAQMWTELLEVFRWADQAPEVRVVALFGNGKHFCSGIDLAELLAVQQLIADDCQGRANEKLRGLILRLQESLSAQEKCRKPVLAAVHGACLGGGLDLIAASDLRYCVKDAFFCLKEIDIGMVADVGSLQRLPKLVAPGLVREWAFTGRRIEPAEAQACGLVGRRPWPPSTAGFRERRRRAWHPLRCCRGADSGTRPSGRLRPGKRSTRRWEAASAPASPRESSGWADS